MTDIDFALPATIFLRRETDLPNDGDYSPHEFDTTAAAIKHAVEEFGETSDFYISAATQRIDRDRVLQAYKDPSFPLGRA